MAKSWSETDVGHGGKDFMAEFGFSYKNTPRKDFILGQDVGCWKAERPAFGLAGDNFPLDFIRSSEQGSGLFNFATQEQGPYKAAAHNAAPVLDWRDRMDDNSPLGAEPAELLDIALAV